MKHCSNKRNINIVKDYLEGNRPFTQISLHISETNKHRKEGESWKDSNNIEWKRENGRNVRLTKTQGDIIREAIGEQRCKICKFNIKWGNKFDRVLFSKTGMCQDCLAEYESRLKIIGAFGLYEQWKLLSNQMGYLIDVKQKIEETIKYFTENDATVELLCNSEGFLEKFHGTNKDKILEDANRDLIEAKKLIKAIKKTYNVVKKDLKAKAKEFKIKIYV